MKIFKVCAIALSVILALVIVFGVVSTFFYYPYYRCNKASVEIQKSTTDEQLSVMSVNLRTIAPTDMGKKSWFYRANLIIENLLYGAPDVIGFQESTKVHYKYLCDSLPEYDSVIEYRDNSPLSEGCPVFYRADKYNLIDKGSFWLSETPEKMSKDWNSKCYRICSYVILETKSTSERFVVFNTHLDHVSDEARINGIKVVLDKIQEFGGYRSMIMGDFNATESSETYKSATENFVDSKYKAPSFKKSCTYQNFGENLDDECIDYIMISPDGFKVESFEVVTNTYEGVYPSDHFPLLAKFTFD